MCVCREIYVYRYIYIYIYIYTADSQIVYTEMVAEQKTEESTPYGSKKHRGYTETNIPPCARIALRMFTPCVRIASDPPCSTEA